MRNTIIFIEYCVSTDYSNIARLNVGEPYISVEARILENRVDMQVIVKYRQKTMFICYARAGLSLN